ncbi:MAG: tyrosine-type recombinase/integrase [Xenococcaceae cyanobacterium]
MYAPKFRYRKANLNVTDKNTYAVNIPRHIAKQIYRKSRKRISLYLSVKDNDAMIQALNHLDKIQKLIDNEDWQGLFDYEESLKPKIIQGSFTKQTLYDFWLEYVKAKSDSWEISYLENDIKQASRLLSQAPQVNLNDDLNPLINYLFEVTTVKQVKRYLKQVSACLTWGVRRKLVKENPLPEFIKTLVTHKKNEEDFDINPFTLKERDLIINAFRTGKYERYQGSHTQYADYIEFNFYTGARTSETLGLKWEHIDFQKKVIKFQEALVLATNGHNGISIQKKGLKTQKTRIFPMNNRLYNLLSNRKLRINPKSIDNVFNDVKHNTFRQGAYRYILKRLNIEYRRPYQTRHTFITIMANNSNLKLHQIAQICGTSISVIEHHYLSNTLSIMTLPEI